MHDSAASFKADVEQSMHSHVDEVEALWDDREHGSSSSSSSHSHSSSFVSTTDIERKARDFRRKKLVRTSAVPSWYKHRNGGKTHVLSGAARVRKFRPGSSYSWNSFF